ncbi:HD domain-containing protein [Candidatus Mycobacterium methanotrophicum]|uniref:HD domain-containing protein n=1 Tax=Candidatus Mycobacterium methanotrophicum TaxID=2943498 RepID=A0ABY4QK87_9MYCO|nr:HD domain-containing protein [Candidatus Mycobacterium methanotrophicum]UQX10733.1 HD domain-containing protein [Candidatus Mycobacterium methanotrophicum]
MSSIVAQAREMAEAFLADALPRRWAHTIGVAAAAERLVGALDTVQPETVVAAAWLHDVGYAPDSADTGFHPIDGAAHVSQAAPDLWSTVNLIAHHSGAVFEAQERGRDSELARYRFPVDVEELAILNAADLCTSPDGALIDPQARLDEILNRYPPDHPVHRAITKSGPLLLAQARLVAGAAEATSPTPPTARPPASSTVLRRSATPSPTRCRRSAAGI